MTNFLQADNWAERKLKAIHMGGGTSSKPYVFETSCVSAREEDINAMRQDPREITYRTMLKHCDLSVVAEQLCYGKRKDVDITLKEDPYVAYYKSTYRGKPCYYLVHSAIEYIWVKR